jgi:hypothetical protein
MKKLTEQVSRKIKIFDSLVISSFFLSLIPVRMVFIEYIGDSWFGSFGLITAIATAVIILTYKGKLGWFGRSIMRFFQKRHKKKRIFFAVQFVFSTTMLVLFIHGVNYADDKFDYEKQEIIALLPNEGMDTMENMTAQAVDEVMDEPWMILSAILVFAYFILFDFDKYALAVWAINDISGGIYMNFATIFLVEEIEVVGLFAFFHFFGRKITQKKQ